MTRQVYLDTSSTTPLAPKVREAMLPFLIENFGNPQSLQHQVGARAQGALLVAKASACALLDVGEDQLILTSGATEANNTVIKGFAARYRHKPHHLFRTAIEHRSVTESCQSAHRLFGSTLHDIPVSSSGGIDLVAFEKSLSSVKGPTLVCVMLVNNEVPLRLPVKEMAALVARYGGYLHCDAVQAFVREPISMRELGVSSLVLSPHKFYGPKGIGLLLLAEDPERATPFEPLLDGGGQELGRRSGTTNAAGAAGAYAAVRYVTQFRDGIVASMLAAQEVFCEELRRLDELLHFVVPPNAAVPGLVGFYIDGVNADALMQAVPHICISRGATCSTGGETYSHVPAALGLPPEVAANVLRASFGLGVSVDDAKYAAAEIVAHSLLA